MTPRWMAPNDEPRVRALEAVCYPDRPPMPEHWYFAHPTLVVERGATVIGATSFTLSPAVRGYVAYGVDLFVHPWWRWQGIGRALADARVAIARSLGAVDFVGVTTPGNAPMIAILTRQGLTEQPAGPDGRVIYIGNLQGEPAWV